MKIYRYIFAVLCFSFFLAGITLDAPFAFLAAIACGALSRTAQKKERASAFYSTHPSRTS